MNEGVRIAISEVELLNEHPCDLAVLCEAGSRDGGLEFLEGLAGLGFDVLELCCAGLIEAAQLRHPTGIFSMRGSHRRPITEPACDCSSGCARLQRVPALPSRVAHTFRSAREGPSSDRTNRRLDSLAIDPRLPRFRPLPASARPRSPIPSNRRIS